MRTDLNLLMALCVNALHLKKPVELRIRTRARKSENGFCGFCEPQFRSGRIVKHVIVINLDVLTQSGFSVNAVIAHELIHACQFEHGFFNENNHHDKRFQMLAKHLRDALKVAGFNTEPLYDKRTDDRG